MAPALQQQSSSILTCSRLLCRVRRTNTFQSNSKAKGSISYRWITQLQGAIRWWLHKNWLLANNNHYSTKMNRLISTRIQTLILIWFTSSNKGRTYHYNLKKVPSKQLRVLQGELSKPSTNCPMSQSSHPVFQRSLSFPDKYCYKPKPIARWSQINLWNRVHETCSYLRNPDPLMNKHRSITTIQSSFFAGHTYQTLPMDFI